MRSSRLPAARSCSSTFCRATARRRWSTARGEARREPECCGSTDVAGAAVLARPGAVDDDCGRLCDSGRVRAALVDDAGGDLRAVLARRRGLGDGLAGLRAIAETADLLSAVRAGRPGYHRYALVGCVVDGAAPRRQSHPQAAGAARTVLSFRTVVARNVGLHRIPGVLRAADG